MNAMRAVLARKLVPMRPPAVSDNVVEALDCEQGRHWPLCGAPAVGSSVVDPLSAPPTRLWPRAPVPAVSGNAVRAVARPRAQPWLLPGPIAPGVPRAPSGAIQTPGTRRIATRWDLQVRTTRVCHDPIGIPTSSQILRRWRPRVHVTGACFGAAPPGPLPGRKTRRAVAPRRPPAPERGVSDERPDTLLWSTMELLLQPPVMSDLDCLGDLPSPLYPFQFQGVRFLADTAPGALLADDMGLGKTVQTIVALRILFQTGRIRSALVVCKLAQLEQWAREFEKWAPLLRVRVCHGPRAQRPHQWRAPAHVHLTTYDILARDVHDVLRSRRDDPAGAFGVAVLDEVSQIRNAHTNRTRAAMTLPATLRWGLSGTPLENDLTDVATVFDFLVPELFEEVYWLYPGDVRERIEPYMLRRRKTDVLEDLPAKLAYDVWIELTPKQRAAYDLALETGIVRLREEQGSGTITVQHVLALLTLLKRICNIDPSSGESAKGLWLADMLEEIPHDEKLIVFSQFKASGTHAVKDRLARSGALKDGDVALYTGDLSAAQRVEVLKSFDSDPHKRCLLLTYGAGSMGLNLQVANYVVLFDHWWNPAIMSQAEDRVHRIGQQRQVMSYRLWVSDTVEERIAAIIARKRDLYDEVIDAQAVGTVGPTGLTESELFGLFGLDPPRRR